MKKLAHEPDQLMNELESLRKSQQLNQLILENAHDLIAVQKLEDLSFEYVNPTTLKVLGYTEAELIEKSAIEFIHPDDLAMVLTTIKENLAIGEGSAEFRYRKKDGSYIWLEVTATLIPDETEKPSLIVISRDITERKQAEEQLLKSEERYRTIFENTGAATMIIEEDLTISMVNEECSRLTGYAKEDLMGRKWTDFFSGDMVETMKEYHRLRRIDPTSVPLKYIAQLKDKGGEIRDGLIQVDMIPKTNKSVVTFIDVTEFNRIDRALKAISAVNTAMIQAENEQDLLQNVCRKIVEVGKYSLVWVGYLQEDQPKKLQSVAYAGNNNGYLAKLNNIMLQDPKRGQGPISTALRTGQPLVARDFEKDDTFKPELKVALRQGFNSGMIIPLMVDNKVFGTMTIYSDQTNAFDDAEQKLLIEMTNNLAYAITFLRNSAEKNQTSQELKMSLGKMQRILMQAVSSLGIILDIKDPYTAGHQKKVALLATAIAKEMGCSKDQIEGISVAANLHDVGKINVPSEILSKPGNLSDLEFAHIRTHSHAGYEIVKDIEFPWPVAEVLLQHHEKMDGSGYPRGLVGEEIIIEARIITVADVVEAMASHRPYRPGLGIDKALEKIAQKRGILYDPDVVDACLKLFREKKFKLE